MIAESKRAQMIAVGGLIGLKEWTGVHSSLVVSPHKIKIMLGKQITPRKWTNCGGMTML